MTRTILTLIASTFIFGAFFAAPALANAKLDRAVEKAVVEKKQTKKVKAYDDHEFNIKAVTVIPIGARRGFYVNGQLSHHLRFRKDDQYYYKITIDRAGNILNIDETINRGGLTRMVLKLPVGEAVQKYSKGIIPAGVTEKIILKAGTWLGRKLDGSWEGAARKIVIQIGMQVASRYQLTPAAVAAANLAPANLAPATKKPITSRIIDHRKN